MNAFAANRKLTDSELLDFAHGLLAAPHAIGVALRLATSRADRERLELLTHGSRAFSSVLGNPMKFPKVSAAWLLGVVAALLFLFAGLTTWITLSVSRSASGGASAPCSAILAPSCEAESAAVVPCPEKSDTPVAPEVSPKASVEAKAPASR